jgi:hypothetical protein
LGTGVSGLRNFSPQQKFWAIGQTVQAVFHFSAKQSAYAWLDYYTEGKFKNNVTATAKSPSLTPQQLNYVATGRLTYRHISLGWKHYFKGSFEQDKTLNYYGQAGFGFLFAKVRNSNSAPVDTSLYDANPREGIDKIRKLTFDLGLGAEQPLGANFFLFADGRLWLPASSNNSPFLTNQRNVPLSFMVSAGLRVLFGLRY